MSKNSIAKAIDFVITMVKTNRATNNLRDYKTEFNEIKALLSEEIIKNKRFAKVIQETTNIKGDKILKLDFGANYLVQLLFEETRISPSIIYSTGIAVDRLILESFDINKIK